MSRSSLAILVGGGLLLVAFYSLVADQEGEGARRPSGVSTEESTSAEPTKGTVELGHLPPEEGGHAAGVVDANGSPLMPPATHTRVPVAQAAFSGVLVNESGSPVAGAQLSWTSYPDEFLAASADVELGHWMIDQERFEERTLWAKTDANGVFSFPEPPAGPGHGPSVIWATHLDYLAAPILLGPDVSTWPTAGKLVMESSSPTRVRVVDGSGGGVQDAAVHAYALIKEPKALQVPLEPEELVRLYLRRSFETDREGRADVPTFPGKTVLSAWQNEHISAPWTGEGGGHVELRLVSSFTVHGRLTVADDTQLETRDITVLIDGWQGGLSHQIARVRLDEDSLTWGPVQIPILDENHFSFSLRAKQVEPRTRFHPRPRPGDVLTIDFESQRGNEVWFALVDKDQNLLNEGLVEIFFGDNSELGSLSSKLRADGYAQFLSCPTGRITTIRGTSPGYAPTTISGFVVPEAEIMVNPIKLLRGGKLAGKCLADGEPVSDFEILLWPTENYTHTSRYRFEGAEDGVFVLENAPLGQLQILASAQGHAPSNPESVSVVAGEGAEVTLLLQSPHSVQGRVVDETGAPLTSATVQLYTETDRYLVAEWGPPVDVDSTGRFLLEGLPPGRAGFKVTAPGYSSTDQWMDVLQEGTQALRTVRLVSLRDLELRFNFVQGVDATLYSASVGTTPRDASVPRSLLQTGVVRFPAISAMTNTVWLEHMGENIGGMRLPKPTGRDWIAEYDFGGNGRLIIDVDWDSRADDLPVTPRVRLDSYVYGDKVLMMYALLPKTGEVVFEALRPGRYVAKVTAGWIQDYGTALVTVADGETTHATIVLDSADTVFRVVDRRGDPVAGVSLSIYDTDYPLWRQAVTDSEGLCTVSGAPAMEAFVGLQHSLLGDLWGVPVQLAQGADEVIELEFVAENTVALRLLDGDVPVAGVTGRLNASDNRNVEVSFSRESTADGRLKFEHLGEALYGVDLRGANTWEKKIEVRATETGETTVQVRRVGNLRFEVSGFNGASPADIAVELTSLEFQTNAEAWIAEGKLLTIPASTRTDMDGSLLFPLIPHGTYRWRLAGPGGKVHEGTADVPVGGEEVVTVGVE